MSYILPHLHNGWQVDQVILSEEDRVVVIRFGHDWDPACMKMDEVLYSTPEKKRQIMGDLPHLAASPVWIPQLNKHIVIDLGTGNNNKINWAMEDKQEMIDIIETAYGGGGAREGRGLVVSPKDYSTKYRY
ncbi:hypothetical protein EI555_018267 [Monodon monoceros]|uniref:Thioredoxin-like protein n=1 Tax=Monodon monoceros TaxID=40151 RepID=A0A4U1FRU0_MONMO|nr:hypothetical protein EI555_018267 [Monodon monoceros]